MKKEYPKSNGDIVSDYSIAQSKALQKCMQLDAEMAYRSLPKQETLEEAKSNYADIHNEVYDIPCANLHINNRELIENAIEFGAKWQQEQMFDIMQQYAAFCVKCDREKLPLLFAKEWFEQFKNK